MLCFSVEFLDGNSKNPQHLALQPTYVSSASLPSGGAAHSNRSSANSFSWERRAEWVAAGAPLCSVGGGAGTGTGGAVVTAGHRHRSRPPHAPVRADQIRRYGGYEPEPHTKSHDRLIRRGSGGRRADPRPKSLCTDAFVD